MSTAPLALGLTLLMAIQSVPNSAEPAAPAAARGRETRVERRDDPSSARARERPRRPAPATRPQPRPAGRPTMLLRPERPAARAAVRIRSAARAGNARRVTRIIALKHVPAQDTMQTIRQWIASEQPQTQTPPVTIVPDAITNQLLVTAESSQLESIEEIVENLDRPAPRIQVRGMIAELHLKEAPESGVGATSKIPAQENLEEMLAMLKKRAEVRVIARPELATASNRPAFVQFGSRVPRITGTTVSQGRGMTNSVTMENVGTILAVTGRVEDKGRVTLEVDVECSHLGPEDEGTPLAVTDGKTIRTPEVKVLVLQTTVGLQSGECMLVGGQVAHTSHGWRETVLLLQVTVAP